MTAPAFISTHALKRFDTPLSLTEPQFSPPWLFEVAPLGEEVEIYRDASGALWVALAPSRNRFRAYRTDIVRFEGALDTDYRELNNF